MLVDTVVQGRQPAAQRRSQRARRVRATGHRTGWARSATGCGCTPGRSTAAGGSAFTPPPDCRYTQRGDRLYLHLFAWPFGHLHLPGLAGRVRYARFLHDGSAVPYVTSDPDQEPFATAPGGQSADTLTLELPVREPGVDVPVVELLLR